MPIAAHARVEGGRLFLDGLVASLDGGEVLRDRIESRPADAAAAGEVLAARLNERGASSLLARA